MMTTRDQIVSTALGFNGTGNGQGYDGPNPFSADLSRPAEAWCGDFVTDIYKRAQIPLPAMQPGCRTGFAYCPDAVGYGQAHGATRGSWEAEPGDITLFDWNGDGVADQTFTNVPAGGFAFTHQYLDNPAGAPNGAFTIGVYVNNVGGSTAASTAAHVSNVAPTLTLDPVAAMVKAPCGWPGGLSR